MPSFNETPMKLSLHTLAVAAGKSVILWTPEGGEGPRTLEGHVSRVHALDVTRDGRLLAAGADGTVILWHTADGSRAAAWDWAQGALNAVAVSPDGMTAAAAGASGQIVLWDMAEATR